MNNRHQNQLQVFSNDKPLTHLPLFSVLFPFSASLCLSIPILLRSPSVPPTSLLPLLLLPPSLLPPSLLPSFHAQLPNSSSRYFLAFQCLLSTTALSISISSGASPSVRTVTDCVLPCPPPQYLNPLPLPQLLLFFFSLQLQHFRSG